ncbi:PREDICTED: uncharacterized protein LOC105154865 isoform X2 [Acromyrmex echinatior]|uniref:uncharacterized protein LOC105154865 isoform X2 n=1 Tax=Acromyrmex echinatior TaxID=103372 RepID=UPI000580D9AE|nr:PREDICTED: uncharacterized protein LOC105154865 isoform X2 [Acromyrmex echinatior]
MKQQWSISENNIELLEEGLYQEKQKCIKKIIFKTNCCTRFILYLKLILLLEVILFFGWGCYMISQTYLPKVIKNEASCITLEKYPPVTESLSEIQESRPIAEIPAIFVKSEIIDKINNLLEGTEFTRDQNLMQNEAIVSDATSMVQTNFQNSDNVQRDNIVQIYDVNRLLATLLSGSLVHNEKFMKNSIPRKIEEKFSSIEFTDEDINTYKKNNFLHHIQFLQKLRDTSKIKVVNDLEKFKSINDFIKDADYLILKSQENYALNAPNNLESLEFNVALTSNLENSVDNAIGYADLTLRDLKFSDLIGDAVQDNNNEDSTLSDETNEQAKRLEPIDLDLPILEEEISKQVKNRSSDDVDKRNEDIHDTNDSDMMSTSTFENQDYLDTSMIMQSTGEQHSSEDIEKITEKIYDESMQPTLQDSVEFSTSNVDKFQWFNVPPRFADLEWKDVSKSDEVSSLFWDTYKEDVDDVIPESQCEMTIKMGILKVKCPTIKFDEEWNFTSSEIPPTDIPKVTDFGDIFDAFLRTQCDEDVNEQLKNENIANENFNKPVTTLQDSRSKIINLIELQESTTNANDASMNLFDEAFIDPSESGNSDENFAFYYFPFYDSNKEEAKHITRASSISKFSSNTVDSNKERNLFFDVFDTHQQEQLKINKQQDYSVSDNSETFLKILKHFYNLEKNLTSLFKNEISNIIVRYLPKSSYENNYRNDICSIIRYMRSISQHSWYEQYALRKFLEYLQNLDYSHITEDYYHRKKRMTDDLAWQEDEISNTLEEDNNDLLEILKKIFQKMEILTLCIDRLHERYLIHNKLDDDYVSSEFPIETEEHRKS